MNVMNKINTKEKALYDFWNHNIHPITGFFLIENHNKNEPFSNDKYFIRPFELPKNKHNRRIEIKPLNRLYDKIETA